MVGDKERRITLHLYDTDITVNIPAGEEELYRQSERLITDAMNTYSSMYKGVNTEKEIQYMALVDIALRHARLQASKDVEPYENILSKLTSEIEDALK